MSEHIVLVGMGVDSSTYATMLAELADAVGASVAYLQNDEPSLLDELDRLASLGIQQVCLVRAPVGAARPARSWLRRVAAHWVRLHPGVQVRVAEAMVTGEEAPLESPAWERAPGHRHHVFVCRGPRCTAKGSGQLAGAIDEALTQNQRTDDEVLVTQTGCIFPCNQAPVVVVHPEDVWYGKLTTADAARIVTEHLVNGEPVENRRLPGR